MIPNLFSGLHEHVCTQAPTSTHAHTQMTHVTSIFNTPIPYPWTMTLGFYILESQIQTEPEPSWASGDSETYTTDSDVMWPENITHNPCFWNDFEVSGISLMPPQSRKGRKRPLSNQQQSLRRVNTSWYFLYCFFFFFNTGLSISLDWGMFLLLFEEIRLSYIAQGGPNLAMYLTCSFYHSHLRSGDFKHKTPCLVKNYSKTFFLFRNPVCSIAIKWLVTD